MGHIASTDQELVAASLRGQRDAFGQLVSRYQDVVCAVSFSSTGDWNLSEDVAQDTFIAAWSRLGQLRETSRLRSWLCGIARNLARKARRRGGREVEIDETVPALDGDPFAATAQAEVGRIVREAFARIPATYREPLVLAAEISVGTEVGVRATPSFLINGKEIRGAVPVEVFRAAIDDALATPAR